MDTITLVEDKIEDGQGFLDRLEDAGILIKSAGWIKPNDEDRWSLYVATPLLDHNGIIAAYRQVNEVLRSFHNHELNSLDIKLVGEKHPIARDLSRLNERRTGRSSNLPGAMKIGDLYVDDVYVYAPGNVKVTIYGMIFDGAAPGALHLSLEPHDPSTRLKIGSGPNSKEFSAITGIDWVVAAPLGSTLERNEINLMSLAWNFRGDRTRSSANEVWSFAKLGLHGFRFLSKPERYRSSSHELA
jgi:hypothetical protein